jgi:hypothetical protein
MTSTVEVLQKARAKIDRPEKWGKGVRGGVDGRRPLHTCCAAEALEDTTPTDIPIRGSAFEALRKAAGIAKDQTLVGWNDAPERTHAEVLAAFDKAIELASNTESLSNSEGA